MRVIPSAAEIPFTGFTYGADGALLSELTIDGDPLKDYVYLSGVLTGIVDDNPKNNREACFFKSTI